MSALLAASSSKCCATADQLESCRKPRDKNAMTMSETFAAQVAFTSRIRRLCGPCTCGRRMIVVTHPSVFIASEFANSGRITAGGDRVVVVHGNISGIV